MSYCNPDFKPFSSGCGMCKPSTDYYSQTQTGGGNYCEDGLIPQSNGKNFYKTVDYSLPLDNKFTKNNFGIDYATANGGVKNKKNKSKRMMKAGVGIDNTDDLKGLSTGDYVRGLLPRDYAIYSSNGGVKSTKDKKKSLKGGFAGLMMTPTKAMDHTTGEEMHHIPGEEMHHIPSKNMNYKQNGGKKTKKSMKGGMESSRATSLPMRFYNLDTPLDNYSELSGNGLMSAYGDIESGDIGTGMLAPYTASTCKTANLSSGMKTGGSKKSKKSMKGGSDNICGYSNNTEFAVYDAIGGKKNKKSKSTSSKLKSKSKSTSSKLKSKSKSTSSKSKSTSLKSKSMKGGMESSGATPLPMRFYNPDAQLDNYPELSGNGSMSAYGAIESGDIGTGMLAPYTASTCQTANLSSGMKTGGSKKNKKSLRGAGGLIPSISDSPVSSIQNGVNGAISGFSNFMAQLDADYLKSVAYVKSIKIGNQRLIQGGSKGKKSSKIEKNEKKQKKIIKKPIKKPIKKKMSIKKGGSNGSDFSLTLNSRGPVNAPDNYWGVPGEDWFRQFNKTGDYIPNSKLPYAATPLLAGQNECGVVSGYDESTLAYPSV